MHTFSFILTLILGLGMLTNPALGQEQKPEKMPDKKVKIEVWSDVVCPFCYLGKKKLEQAIRSLDMENEVEVIYHAFQLDPGFPKGKSVLADKHLVETRGYDPDQLRMTQQRLTEAGKGYGIAFNFDRNYSFNTYDAHRLIQWSRKYAKQSELKDALMRAYFSDGKDLSSTKNLLAVAGSLGLNTEEARAVLNSDEYADAVEYGVNQASQQGVRGVPYFLINGELTISGAQDDRVFEQRLQEALKGKEDF